MQCICTQVLFIVNDCMSYGMKHNQRACLGGLGASSPRKIDALRLNLRVFQSQNIICKNNHEMKSQELSLFINIISYGMET